MKKKYKGWYQLLKEVNKKRSRPDRLLVRNKIKLCPKHIYGYEPDDPRTIVKGCYVCTKKQQAGGVFKLSMVKDLDFE